MAQESVPKRFVAFCDILGFGSMVESSVDQAIVMYEQLMEDVREENLEETVALSVYSDSILMVAESLPPFLRSVQHMWMRTLTNGWLMRGGISHGSYWRKKHDGHLFVVSDALVRAVRIEGSVSYSAIAISREIELTLPYWVPRFEHGIFVAPVLHFRTSDFRKPVQPLLVRICSHASYADAGKVPPARREIPVVS